MKNYIIKYYRRVTLVDVKEINAGSFASAAEYARNNAPEYARRFTIEAIETHIL